MPAKKDFTGALGAVTSPLRQGAGRRGTLSTGAPAAANPTDTHNNVADNAPDNVTNNVANNIANNNSNNINANAQVGVPRKRSDPTTSLGARVRVSTQNRWTAWCLAQGFAIGPTTDQVLNEYMDAHPIKQED